MSFSNHLERTIFKNGLIPMDDKTNLDSKPNFSSLAKFMHWGFVLLFIYGLVKQIDELNQLEDKALLQFEVIFATVFVLLLLIRFIYMKTTQKSSLPESTQKSQLLAARVVDRKSVV